jgi:hypothetical protein
MENGKQEWIEVDIDGLSSALSENDLTNNTKGIPEKDIWQSDGVLTADGKGIEIVKTIRPHWATLFWNGKQNYLEIIRSFSKLQHDEHQAGETEGKPEGTDQQQVE